MRETWRWFGPADAVTLPDIRQTGAQGIVTALHDIPYGKLWSVEAIRERQAIIGANPALGLSWAVVESLPVHEAIKLGPDRAGRDLEPLFETYRQSLRNLAACGVATLCYNFMAVLDWTRTELSAPVPSGGTTLRFNRHEAAALDCHMMRRPGAEADYSNDVLARAADWYDASTEESRAALLAAVMAGLPGAYDRYDVPGLKAVLARYDGMTHAELRANLVRFLEAVIPAAEEAGIRMCIHPDDPPHDIFGLPRIVTSGDDIAAILDAVPSRSNGLTLCSGSLGANPGNDVPEIARRFADRIHFAHLRNVAKDADGSFMEAEHLGGDTDMVALVGVLLAEEKRRRAEGRADHAIPMRPDHGQELLGDAGKGTHPGYPLIGRMKGLAELRGVMLALERTMG